MVMEGYFAERLFVNMVNMNDIKVIPRPDTIITSDEPAITNLVKEFMRSIGAPDTAERADNVYKGKYQHIVLPYLATTNLGAPTSTGRFFWFLTDLKHKDAILEFSEMPTFTMGGPSNGGEEFETENWKAKSTASYAYGILDYKWAVGSSATSV